MSALTYTAPAAHQPLEPLSGTSSAQALQLLRCCLMHPKLHQVISKLDIADVERTFRDITTPDTDRACLAAHAPPPKTMNTTMTAGPMATAASVDGATEPTASPSAEDVKDSSVRMPRNDANLRHSHAACDDCRLDVCLHRADAAQFTLRASKPVGLSTVDLV